MIRQRVLTPGNDVPRLAHPLKLAPQEKIRLVLRTPQAVYIASKTVAANSADRWMSTCVSVFETVTVKKISTPEPAQS